MDRAHADSQDKIIAEIQVYLASGISASTIESNLTEKYHITPRQVRSYISAAYGLWQAESEVEAPFRREKLIRMAEQIFQRALEKGDLFSANTALKTLTTLGSSASRRDPALMLGPPPTGDPTVGLVYAQNALLLSMQEVTNDPNIDPETRWRLISDMAGKIGMTHAKALVQHKLDSVSRKLLGSDEDRKNMGTVKTADHVLADPINYRPRQFGKRTIEVSGHAAVPPSSQNGGNDSEGGGPVGSS